MFELGILVIGRWLSYTMVTGGTILNGFIFWHQRRCPAPYFMSVLVTALTSQGAERVLFP